MKTIKFAIGICVLALVFTSCKDDKSKIAKENVDEYATYVDSITNLDLALANENWETIENGYQKHKSAANVNLNLIAENADLKDDVDNATLQYEEYKMKVVADNEEKQILVSKNNFRTALLGQNYTANDMAFTWINKDNILGVYETFVNTVEMNKDSYSREDWDEIKLLYEAIDTRKNTVENEGLTGENNRKIAALKLKFAPMYTLNRMGAKSQENADAKK
jgi:hypothetical protein